MNRDQTYLLDILQAARRVRDVCANLDEAGFAHSEVHQLAALYLLAVIGEASRRLSQPTRASLADVPWRDMIAMRNIVIHEYDRVTMARVWEVINRHVPALIARLEPLVPPERPD